MEGNTVKINENKQKEPRGQSSGSAAADERESAQGHFRAKQRRALFGEVFFLVTEPPPEANDKPGPHFCSERFTHLTKEYSLFVFFYNVPNPFR